MIVVSNLSDLSWACCVSTFFLKTYTYVATRHWVWNISLGNTDYPENEMKKNNELAKLYLIFDKTLHKQNMLKFEVAICYKKTNINININLKKIVYFKLCL